LRVGRPCFEDRNKNILEQVSTNSMAVTNLQQQPSFTGNFRRGFGEGLPQLNDFSGGN
jgi:cytochrome c peroxidase